MIKDSLIKEFEAILGKEYVLTGEADRQVFSYDATAMAPVMPAAVLFPTSTEQLAKIIPLCYENDLPITVRGAGTCLSGGATPDSSDTIVISTTNLNKILEIHENDLYAVVEPGVVTQHFANEVTKRKLFYPPDPGSQSISTLGGNVAENAGGLRGLKYGVTKNYVMGMDFYDFEGNLVSCGSRTVKCATGYDLPALMVGSEGTLGVISKLILKLIPPPKASKAIMAIFDTSQAAAEAVAGIIAAHIVPCTLEFMDKMVINCVEGHAKVGFPLDAEAVLLIEVDGHPAQVEEEAIIIEKILKSCKVRSVKVAKDDAEKEGLWEGRRSTFAALSRMCPSILAEDVTVPRSKVPEMLASIYEASEKYDIPIAVCGHVGDGNMHPNILYDMRDKSVVERVEKAADHMFLAAIEHGGTLSGEHGIGTAKKPWMEKGVGMNNIIFSRRLRRAADPKGLFNALKVAGV